jgi:hypothetical protein
VEDGRRAGLAADGEQAPGDEVERLVPAHRLQLAVLSQQRAGDPLGPVLQGEEMAGPVAEEPPGDRVVAIAVQPGDAAVLDGGDDPAGVGTVAAAGGLPELAHRASLPLL